MTLPVSETSLVSSPRPLRGQPAAVQRLLGLSGALLQGHFQLLAGAHTEHFFAFSRVAQEPSALDEIASWLIPELHLLDVGAVVAPSSAGAGLGFTLAQHLGVPLHLSAVNDRGRAEALLGAPQLDGRRVLLVNDVVTTGHGLQRLAEVVRDQRGTVIAATWFLTRSHVDVPELLGVPVLPIVEWELPAWEREACAACSASDQPAQAYDLN